MCQRLVVPNQDQVEKEVSVAHPWWRFSVRFNVAVTQRVPVARLHEGEREGVMVRWGFVPEPEEGEPFEESRVGAAHVRSEALVGATGIAAAQGMVAVTLADSHKVFVVGRAGR